jgi:hypothetical protein
MIDSRDFRVHATRFGTPKGRPAVCGSGAQ